MSALPASPRPVDERLQPLFREAPARVQWIHGAPAADWPAVAAERFELISRGDRVEGLLARAPGPSATRKKSAKTPRPALLLAVHDAGESLRSPGLVAASGWVGPELALAAIDLPLHGHRASPKLSERLFGALAQRARGESPDRNGSLLVEAFVDQATIDLARALDALLALDVFDRRRVGLLALGLGAALLRAGLARDERIGTAVLIESDAAAGTDSEARSSGPSISVLSVGSGENDWVPRARTLLASRLGF